MSQKYRLLMNIVFCVAYVQVRPSISTDMSRLKLFDVKIIQVIS